MSIWVLERGNMNQAVLSNKQALVAEISEKMKNSQSTVVCEYRGLSVAEVTELRRNLRAEDVDFKVYKNTMVERACEDCGFGELKDALNGPNAFAFSSDATAPARVLAKFAKKHKALVLKSGIVEGKVVDEIDAGTDHGTGIDDDAVFDIQRLDGLSRALRGAFPYRNTDNLSRSSVGGYGVPHSDCCL